MTKSSDAAIKNNVRNLVLLNSMFMYSLFYSSYFISKYW